MNYIFCCANYLTKKAYSCLYFNIQILQQMSKHCKYFFYVHLPVDILPRFLYCLYTWIGRHVGSSQLSPGQSTLSQPYCNKRREKYFNTLFWGPRSLLWRNVTLLLHFCGYTHYTVTKFYLWFKHGTYVYNIYSTRIAVVDVF